VADELLHDGTIADDSDSGRGSDNSSGSGNSSSDNDDGEQATTSQLTLSQVYLRGSQLGNLGALVGLGIGALLAQVALALPLIIGGLIFGFLALAIALLMPEAGFTRTPAAERESWRQLLGTARSGFQTVRTQPILLTMLVITAFVGAWSESFDRLWTKHLVDNFTLPTIPVPALGELDWVAWFAIIQAIGLLLSLGVSEIVRRRVDTANQQRLVGALTVINGMLFVGALLFANAQWFGTALIAFWLIGVMRTTTGPLFSGWINQYVNSNVRATVLSIHGQSDAIGQVVGGPLIGLVGTVGTLRAALRTGSLLLLPAMILYARLLRKDK
jgi:DHA3 family tetracycline resistance protein-like MFS transporter